MKIAQIQMHVSADKAENIRHACELVRSAGDIDLGLVSGDVAYAAYAGTEEFEGQPLLGSHPR